MPRTSAIDRAAALLIAIARSGQATDLAAHARHLDIPLSSAYRIAASLTRHGLIAPARRGTYGAGYAWAALADKVDRRDILYQVSQPLVRRLARDCRATAHLGVFEDEMVTYLVKEAQGKPLFTREGKQLEAYCSAIGKLLLSSLDDEAVDRYLAGGQFVTLTDRTITDPQAIRAELLRTRERDYGTDCGELADDVMCIAVPVRDTEGQVIAALSLSRRSHHIVDDAPPDALVACRDQIEARLGRTASDGGAAPR